MSDAIIVFITKDLYFIPMLRQASEQANCSFLFAPSLASPRLDSIEAQKVVLCVVDLTAVAIDHIPSLAESLREKFAAARLVAFGPHVHEQALQSAADVQFDDVLTRGQLNKNTNRLVLGWVGGAAQQ